MSACLPGFFFQEISKAIGGSWTEANEEDLLAELAEIEKEAEPAAVPQPAPTVEEAETPLEDRLPVAPDGVPVVPVPAAGAESAPQQAAGEVAEERVPVAA